ncbi:MAG: cupin domain-containing protein [Candidatus Obscuribacterales bacterium]|nr:cupin domain-containing protein [Candidatus Obscuribacterales bacterium]
MNVTAIVRELAEQHPNSVIKELPPGGNAKEIVCEIPAKSSEHSKAIAVIDESQPHFHRKTDEHYKILRGQLRLFIDNVEHVMNPGDIHIVKPNQVHYAIGDATVVEVDCYPAYSLDDHFLV